MKKEVKVHSLETLEKALRVGADQEKQSINSATPSGYMIG